MNLESLRTAVRTFTGIWSQDTISDQLIDTALNLAVDEIARAQKWPADVVFQSMSSNGDSPGESWGRFHHALIYRVAIQALAYEGDESNRSEMFAQEYAKAVSEMAAYFLPDRATGASTNLAQMARYVRDLTGVYDTRYSDYLIQSWLQEAYSELASARDWTWLESVHTASLTAGETQETLPGGARKVLEVWATSGDNTPEEMFVSPQVFTVEDNDPFYYYDVASDGTLTWHPPLRSDSVLEARYVLKDVNLSTGIEFDQKFSHILPYRVAAKIAALMGDRAKAEVFTSEYGTLFDLMVSEYQLDHDTRPFQLGSRGLETRKYLPWFRTA